MTMANEVILIVDDDVLMSDTLGAILREKGFSTIVAVSGSEAMNLDSSLVPEVALIDLKLSDMSGLDVIRELKQSFRHLEFIVITGYSTSESAIEAMNLGAYGYIEKPYNLNHLLQMIQKALEKRKNELALVESESRFRQLVEKAPVGILAIDVKGSLMQYNQKSLEIFDFEPDSLVQGLNVFNFLPFIQSGITGDLKQCIYEGRAAIYEHRYQSEKGAEKTIRCNLSPRLEADGSVYGALGIFEDVSGLKQLESHLKQVMKIESIGMLAGGIAHDFNNILSAIIGFSELALNTACDMRQEQNLNEVLKAGSRAKNLVKQILTVSRQGKTEKHPIEIGLILKDVISFLRASLPATIEMKYETSGEDIQIFGNSSQVHQLLLNLCINAGQAMEKSGGVLKIRVKKTKLDHDIIGNNLLPVSGRFVNISIIDNGTGITPSALEKIFEPYYTTKKKGEGTGLGLAVVDSIVKAHEGFIDVTTTIGRGSAFEVYLPVVDQPADNIDEIVPKKQVGKGTILLVDDEEAIVNLYTQVFESLGYYVEGLTNSQEALRLFQTQPDFYDIMITDMTMPKMTGDELAKEILGTRPQFPIILCTGFSKNISREKAHKIGIRRYLEKPVEGATLAAIVHEILNTPL